MDKFEGVYIPYMLNTARMAFAVINNYPLMTVTNGQLVRDTSQDARDLKAEASAGYDLIKRVQDRQKRGIRIPRTWTVQLEKLESLVMALRVCKSITEEWAEEFFRSLRWLRTLTA